MTKSCSKRGEDPQEKIKHGRQSGVWAWPKKAGQFQGEGQLDFKAVLASEPEDPSSFLRAQTVDEEN